MGEVVKHLHLPSTYCIPGSLLGTWHVLFPIILRVTQQGRCHVYILQTSFSFGITYAKPWGYKVVELESNQVFLIKGHTTMQPLSPYLGCKPLMDRDPDFFLWCSLVQLVLPWKLWPAMNSWKWTGECYKKELGTSGQCLSPCFVSVGPAGRQGVCRVLLCWPNLILLIKTLLTFWKHGSLAVKSCRKMRFIW